MEKSREVRVIGHDPDGRDGQEQPAGDSSGFLSLEQIEANPERLAQMSDYIAGYERTWLEEPIPALGESPPEPPLSRRCLYGWGVAVFWRASAWSRKSWTTVQ